MMMQLEMSFFQIRSTNVHKCACANFAKLKNIHQLLLFPSECHISSVASKVKDPLSLQPVVYCIFYSMFPCCDNLHRGLTVWPSVCVVHMLVDTFLMGVESRDAQPVDSH